MTTTLLRAPRRAATVALAGLALVPIAGCGGDEAAPGAGGGDSKLASLAPASAPVYLEAAIQPDGKLKDDINGVIKKFAPDQDIEKLTDLAFKDSTDKVNFQADVKPWLGKRAGVFFTGVKPGSEDPEGAALVEVTDTGKALETVKKGSKGPFSDKEYKGTKYSLDASDDTANGIVDDTLVAGTESGFKAVVDAAAGDGLDSNAEYTKMVDKVDDDAVGFVYGDVPKLFAFAKSASSTTSPEDAKTIEGFQEYLNRQGITTFAAGLSVKDSAVKFTTASTGKDSGQADAAADSLASLPAGSWAGLGLGDIGKTISDGLDSLKGLNAPGFNVQEGLDMLEQQAGIDVQKDLLSWMGNTGLFVRGTSISDIGGALVVQSKDASATKAALSKARTIAAGAGLPTEALSGNGIDDGFSIKPSGAPFEAYAALAGDKFILAVSKSALDEALKPTKKLSDDDGYKAAVASLGDGVKPSFFLDFPKVSGLIGLAAGGDADYAKAKPYLDKITTIAAGGKRDGDVNLQTFSVGVK